MEDICRKFQEQIPQLITNTLSAEKAAELQQHIAVCPACSKYLQDLQGDDKLLGDFTEAMQPRIARLEEKVIGALNREPSEKPISSVSIWRKIMKSRITKLAAAAAVIIIAVFWWLDLISGPNMAGVAWAKVTAHVDQVDFVHFYELKFRENRVNSSLEGWFSDGRLVAKKHNGTMFFDDGVTETVFDQYGQQIRKGPSELGNIKGMKFFEKITQGLMQYENEDLLRQVPSHVGHDFLIYRFNPPERMGKWVESISVTVGINSLLPVQMKIRRKDQENAYDLYIFDYEEREKPAEFFETKSVSKPPQGKAEIVLDSEEVIIDISDSPGIEAVAVRLYNNYFENMGELNVLDLAVITTDGIRGQICRQMPLELNKPSQFSFGGSKHWPDKKFRHVMAKIVLRPTEKENVYLAEVSCWLDRVED
jgi:hypothetical protein